MNRDELIPKNKIDFAAVEKIRNISAEDILPVLPEIFEWLEDINWPVAQELVKVLPKFDDAIIPFVIDLLRYPDGLREYPVYFFMLPLFNKHQLDLINDELERIAFNPSELEKEEGYDKISLEYRNKLKNL